MKHTTDTYSRKPYSGLSRSLVIAIDVGTTFSGVSYAILEPGEVPKIHGVTRFPGQEHVAGNSKIPSVIYYDKYGTVMAAGADADGGGIIGKAEDEGWIRAELFKLRLRPRTMQLNMNGMRLTPLPKRKNPVHVFGDFLKYLLQCTHSFITDTHANGTALWNTVQDDVQFVLSHPNGWEGPQQTRMRNAAVHGGLVPDTDAGRARIRFVTEGEASLHACVLSGLAADVLSNTSKNGFLIADAGGGTLDISAYAIKGTQPLAMEEIAPPDCLFAGSVFVSRRAREFFAEKLKHSKYGTPDAIDHITRKFDETTKRLFRDRNELQFVPFGSPLDKDPSVGVRNGQLKLTGNEVANLFEPSVDAAVNAIKAQIEASNGVIKSVFLVGGYAASPWLFTQLQERLAPLNVSRPDTQTSKAVADGAIGFYCDHHVSARMSKFMYGVEFLRELDLNDPDHVARKEKLCELPSGPQLLPDAFDCILSRSVKVKESTVFTRKYCTELTNLSMLSVFEVEIWCFRGGNLVPKWIDRGDSNFSTLCVVQADLSLLNGSAEPKVGKNGKKYWTIVFSVEIHFGLTEFKARIKWMDNGKTKYGPAVIVYNERGHRVEDDDIDVYPEDDATVHSSRSDRRSERPSSRSQTPVDAYYPPGSASTSRRTSSTVAPEAARVERNNLNNMGYPPSITPSTRTANLSGHTNRGSDGDRTGNDSERKKDKGKDRRRDEASALATPADHGRGNSIYAPSISRGLSGGSLNGEHLSAGWNASAGAGATPGYSHSRSPSIKEPPQPSSQSIYGGNGGGGGWDDSAPPRSAVSERQSHLWDNPPQSAALDAILERPKSPYPDRPKSPFVAGASQSGPRSPYLPPDFNERPKSPFVSDPPPARAPSPFVDRPKSAFGDAHGPRSPFLPDPPPRTASPFVDGPKSAFGEAHPSAVHTPIFGDSGPAANAGGDGNSLFGNNPTSVFGEASGGNSNSMFGNPTSAFGQASGGATDTWGLQETAVPSPIEAPPKSAKSKKKGSLAVSPVGTLGKTSPALGGAGKSPFGKKSPNAFLNNDEPAAPSPIVAAPASPVAAGGGSWGTKAPSPFDKKDKHLSPLNPAAQMTPGAKTPAKEQNEFEWGANDNNGGGTAAAGDSWGNFNNNENAYQEPSPISKTPISKTPVSKTPGSKTPKSKTPAKEQNAFDWGSNDQNTGAAAAGDSWGNLNNNENSYQEHQSSPVSKTPVSKTPGSKTPKSKTPTKEQNALGWGSNDQNTGAAAAGDSWGNLNNNENAYQEHQSSPVSKTPVSKTPVSKTPKSKTPTKEQNALSWGSNDQNTAAAGDSWSNLNNNENAYHEHQPSPGSKTLGSKTPAKEHNDFDWGYGDNNAAGGAGNAGGDSWGNFNNENAYNENGYQEHASVEPPPVEEPASVVTPVDEVKETVVKGKKKKKGAAGKSVAQEAYEKEEEERKKRDDEEEQRRKAEEESAAEAERLKQEKEEADRQAEAIRIKEQDDQAERDSIARKDAEEKAAKEKEEQDRMVEEEAEKAAAAAAHSSIFGDTSGGIFSGGLFSSSSLTPPDKPWVGEPGGGDDGASWGPSSWGKPTTKKGKKSPLNSATTKPPAFGFGVPSAFGGGSSWGMTGSVFGSGSNEPENAASPNEAIELPSTDTWSFNTSGPNLGLGYGTDPKPLSQAPSLQPQGEDTTTHQEEEKAPGDVLSPAADREATPAAETAEGAAEDGEGGAAGGKKKKKKKGKGGNEEPTPIGGEAPQEEAVETPVAEVPETPAVEATPEQAAPTAGRKKGKKKK